MEESKEIEDMTEEELDALPKDPSENTCTSCEG